MKTNKHTQIQRSSGIRSYIVAAVLFTLAAGAAWFSINQQNIQEYREAHKNRETEMAEIAELKQHIGELKRKQQSLLYNGMESEKQIRERLQMHKPGEKVVFFVEQGESSTTPTVETGGRTESVVDEDAGAAVGRSTQQPQQEPGARKSQQQESAASPSEIRSVYDAM